MPDVIKIVKEKMGYLDEARSCGSCKNFKVDMSTDNFGGGDRCVRNPDFCFSTDKGSSCDNWKAKS